MKKDDRFIITEKQGSLNRMDVIVDKITGVHYLYVQSGNGGGLTPLLDSNGKVIVKQANNDIYNFF